MIFLKKKKDLGADVSTSSYYLDHIPSYLLSDRAHMGSHS